MQATAGGAPGADEFAMLGPIGPPWRSLVFPAAEREVRQVLTEIDAQCAAALPPALRHAAQIVLAEVLNNIVEHAYGAGASGLIRLQIWKRPDHLICHVRDTGAPLPEETLRGTPAPMLDPETPDSWPEGGFGWSLVRDLTTDLCYQRADAENVLQFRIPPDSADIVSNANIAPQ